MLLSHRNYPTIRENSYPHNGYADSSLCYQQKNLTEMKQTQVFEQYFINSQRTSTILYQKRKLFQYAWYLSQCYRILDYI